MQVGVKRQSVEGATGQINGKLSEAASLVDMFLVQISTPLVAISS